MTDTIRLRVGRGRRETLGTFGPGRGSHSRVSKDYDPRTDHAAIACPPGACPSTSDSPMERPTHESSRPTSTTTRGGAGASDPTLPSTTPTGFGHRVTLPDGERISYVDIGPISGRPILYFHATPGSRMWAAGLAEDAGELGLRLLAPERPGCGGSSFYRYGVRDYPQLVARFADALGIADFGVIGVSGGGRYACACAAGLGSRVTRVALVASTAPPELPGVRATWSRQDRQLYTLADKAPWLLRVALTGLARSTRSEPDRALRLFTDLPAVDERALERPDVRERLAAMIREAFRQGARGPTHDLTLEARPWNIDLGAVEAPVDVWHGTADTFVSVQQAEILVRALPDHANFHILTGEGHLSLVVDHMREVLQAFT
jgi:pimeloyl-ACP methyl ester carboxylesterase